MKKNKLLIKFILLLVVGAAVYLVPENINFTYGYGTGNPPEFAGSTTNPPDCGKPAPARPLLYEPGHSLLPKAVNGNEVRLNWLKVDNADRYTVAYGVSSGNYIWGWPDAGNVDHFTVGNLNSGVRYYFAVRGVNDCMPGPWSQEWSYVAGGGNATGGSYVLGSSTYNNQLAQVQNENVQNPVNTNPYVAPQAQTQQPQTINPVHNTYTQPAQVSQPENQSLLQTLWSGILHFFGL